MMSNANPSMVAAGFDGSWRTVMDTNRLRKSRTTQAVQLLAAAALLVTLTQAASAHDEDRWYRPREHDWHGGMHRDWHAGRHYGLHDKLHWDRYDGWHYGQHYGPHAGRHYDWHRGAHHDWYGGGHDD